MAKANVGGLVILGGVIIILLLFSGQIISAISTGGAGLSNFINTLLSGGNPITGGSTSENATGNAWFAFTIHFKDGTSSDINMNPTFSIFPMSISYSGKTITQLDVLIRAQFTGSNLGAWNTQASQHIEVYLSPSTTPVKSSTGYFNDNGDSWASGETKTILTTSITSTVLDPIFRQYASFSDWLFQTTGVVNITINVNGAQQTLSATLTAGGVDLSFNPAYPSYSVGTIAPTNFIKYPLHK